MSNNLNNQVVIPAKNSIDFPTISLAKNNAIERVQVANPDFLKVEQKKDKYTFLEISNIRGTTSEDWKDLTEKISVKSFHFEGEDANKANSVEIANASTTLSGVAVRISCDLRYFVNAGNILNKEGSNSTGSISIYNGETRSINYEFEHKSGVGTDTATITVTFSYLNGSLTVYAEATSNVNYIHFKKWTCDVDIKNVEVLSTVFSSDTHEVTGELLGTKTFLFNETSVTMADDNEIFVMPDVGWVENVSASVMASAEGNPSQEVLPEWCYFVDAFFESLADFRNYCVSSLDSDLKNTYNMIYIGLPKSIKKDYANHLRFEKTTTIYTCTLVRQVVTVGEVTSTNSFSDYIVKIKANDGKAYKIEQLTRNFGTNAAKEKTFTINSNSLHQAEMSIDGSVVSIDAAIGSAVLDKFKNGRKTTSLSIFYGKYLDFNGQVVYDETNGYFPKVDDIVMPYTIRNMVGGEEISEVPLFSSGYETDANGQKKAIGKQFYVTSCNLEYDGDFTINLEMLERTGGTSSDSLSGERQYTLYMPMLPTSGVENVEVYRDESPSGKPTGLLATATETPMRYTVYDGDKLRIVGVGTAPCYNDPTVTLSSYEVKGDVYASIEVGSIKKYTVSFDFNGGVDGPAPFVVNCGATVYLDDIQVPYRSNDSNYSYRFEHWELDGSAVNSFDIYSDVVVVARYYRTAHTPIWQRIATLGDANTPYYLDAPYVENNNGTKTSSSKTYLISGVKAGVKTRFGVGYRGIVNRNVYSGPTNGLHITVNGTNTGYNFYVSFGSGTNDTSFVTDSSGLLKKSSTEAEYGKTQSITIQAVDGGVMFTGYAEGFKDSNDRYAVYEAQKGGAYYYYHDARVRLNYVDQDVSTNIIV